MRCKLVFTYLIMMTLFLFGQFNCVCFATNECQTLHIVVENNSEKVWRYDEEKSTIPSDASWSSSMPNTIDPGSSVELILDYDQDQQAKVYLYFESGQFAGDGSTFLADGDEVELGSFRDRVEEIDPNCDSTGCTVGGKVLSGRDMAQLAAQINGFYQGPCHYSSLAPAPYSSTFSTPKVSFSLLDPAQQTIDAQIEYNSATVARETAKRGESLLTSDNLVTLDIAHGKPFTLTSDGNKITYHFVRACSDAIAQEYIDDCVAQGKDEANCEQDSCYYQPAPGLVESDEL